MENPKFYPNLHSKYCHRYDDFQNCPVLNLLRQMLKILTAEWKIANLVMESHGKVMEFHFQGCEW